MHKVQKASREWELYCLKLLMRCSPSFRIRKISMDFCCQKLCLGASSLQPLSISAFTSKSMKALRTQRLAFPLTRILPRRYLNGNLVIIQHVNCGAPPKLPRGHLTLSEDGDQDSNVISHPAFMHADRSFAVLYTANPSQVLLAWYSALPMLLSSRLLHSLLV